MRYLLSLLLVCVCLTGSLCQAGLPSKAVREVAEFVLRKGEKEAAEIGLETLTRKIETLAARYGDDALTAVKKSGSKTFRLVEEAGEQGALTVKLLARYGDDAAWLVARKSRLSLFAKYGDEAAEVLLRHGEAVEPLVGSLGTPATAALKNLSTQNGRRLVMLADDATLAKIGRTDELLGVVSRYGDNAMNFIWKNKGALAVGAALAAFLANPQPFIDGTKDITQFTVESLAKPVAAEVAKNANWTLVLPVVAVIAGLYFAFRFWLKHRAALPSNRTAA